LVRFFRTLTALGAGFHAVVQQENRYQGFGVPVTGFLVTAAFENVQVRIGVAPVGLGERRLNPLQRSLTLLNAISTAPP